MSYLFQNQTGIYPEKIIQRSYSVPNGAVRLSTPLRRSSSGIEGEGKRLTLRETPEPELGAVYDDFDIKSFTIDNNSHNAKVQVNMSLTSVHENLAIFAKLVDLDSQEVLAEMPLRTASDTYQLDYQEEVVLPAQTAAENVTLIAYGAWGTKESDDVEIALVENYEAGAPQIYYDHIYPQKESSFITFPTGKTIADVAQDRTIPYDAANSVRDEEHIVVALYRRPTDTRDLDYLCLFGQKPGTTQPLLGGPGKGNFHAVSGSKFLYEGENEPVASCIISPIGGTTGGSMVVASTRTYEAEKGAIKLTPGASSLQYDMTGPWGVAYQELGGWNVKKFDYQFQISYTLQTGAGTPRRWTSYICSNKEYCLEKVKPIALKYGCFQKGTRIAMADGSQRKIETIRIGDCVVVEGGTSRIRNIWRGMDKILTITLEDGVRLGVTEDHPLRTPEGWVRAKEIRKGMHLIAWGVEKICCVQSVEAGGEDEVYNLETERDSGCAIGANGIAAGDFFLQNNL